jgi:hypothetical protein
VRKLSDDIPFDSPSRGSPAGSYNLFQLRLDGYSKIRGNYILVKQIILSMSIDDCLLRQTEFNVNSGHIPLAGDAFIKSFLCLLVPLTSPRATLQISLDLCFPEKELAKTRSQISIIYFQSHS